MDTDSLYLALSEKELYDCIREESEAGWGLLTTKNCKDDFTANATTNFFPRTCCPKHMKLLKSMNSIHRKKLFITV